mgnify:CR=1 FL=1
MNKMNQTIKQSVSTRFRIRTKNRRKQYLANIVVFAPLLLLIMFLMSCTVSFNKSKEQPTTNETEEIPVVDMEVYMLQQKLNKHGIDVFRVNPNDAEHQRRYKRQLIRIDIPEKEEWI